MSTNTMNESAIVVAHKREADGKVTITSVLPGGETFSRSIWPQEAQERSQYINDLCADKPGITSERKWLRAELQKIARATEIDLRFNTCGQINGRASCSARLWAGSKVIETYSLNLLAPEAREKAIKHLAKYVAGRNASKRKLSAAERDLARLFMSEVQRVLTMPAQQPRAPREQCPYRDDGHGIVMQTKDGEIALTNFSARITSIVTRHDGSSDPKSEFELEVSTGASKRKIFVGAKEFGEMKWPLEQLHTDGYIHPDRNASSHARAAIMLFSKNPEPARKTIHTHTGWIQVGDTHAYLHGGGAIAADPELSVDVELHPALARYSLPAPPQGADLALSVRASLKVLELASDRLTFPAFCAVWRAVLGHCDSAVFIVGPSGTFKSELAALLQQHFGAGLDKFHLPANWSSTKNALELLAFACKDALLTIDDFAPCGSLNEVNALHGAADRIFRAQANHSGRQRSSKDSNVGESRPPRGMILSTGEDIPRGHSLRARLIIDEVSPGDIDPHKLTQCQRDARDGVYARACAGFIRWLCEGDRIATIQKGMREKIAELRDRAALSQIHRRTPEAVANLAIGLLHFIEFAIDTKVLTPSEADALWKRGWNAIGESAQRQAAHQVDNEPAKRFLDLLMSSIASGGAHLAGANGNAPVDPDDAQDDTPVACGWRRHSPSALTWEPQGLRIGWVDNGEIYLDPDASYQAAQRAAGGGGDALVIAAATLRKRLRERGFLQGVSDEKDQRTAVRRRLAGALRMVLWLASGALPIYLARTARTEGSSDPQIPFIESETKGGA